MKYYFWKGSLKKFLLKKSFFSKDKFCFVSMLFLSLVLNSQNCYAWNGYDYDNKTEVEIGPGNLIREGMVFQFYDSKDDNYHTAKINFMQPNSMGTEIELEDLDTKKKRVFIMSKDE